MSAIAKERDITRSLQWRIRVRITYEPEHFVLVDESAADGRTTIRREGYAKRGEVAKTNRYFFHRGTKYSVLGPFVFDEGFLDISTSRAPSMRIDTAGKWCVPLSTLIRRVFYPSSSR